MNIKESSRTCLALAQGKCDYMKIISNSLGVMLLIVAGFLSMAMLFISSVHDHTSKVMLKQQIYEQGIALTGAISKTLWETIGDGDVTVPGDVLKDKMHASMSNKITSILNGTPVLKLKLFDSAGKMKYSSNIKDMIDGDGDDLKVLNKVNLVSLSVVKTKKPVSSYRFRDVFDDGKTIYHNRYIISAYLPTFIPYSDNVGGVVEIYYDVTKIITDFNSNRMVSNIMLAVSGFVLFIMLAYLIARNDKITRNKENEREKYLGMIKDKNKALVKKSRELTQIKERTEKIAEERSVFMSRMSHELRTPMNAVIGLTDLIMQTNLSDKQRGYVSAIQSSGNILLDITDEILTIGRLETGYLEIKNQKYLLRDVIENVLEVMGNRAYKQGLELVCHYSPELDSYVKGDPVRLRQVLLNLVGNAIKFTPHGSVSIHVTHVKGSFGAQHYRFEIHDTGVGIKEEDKSRVFAAYCHLNENNTSRVKNSGLGLAISQRLVEAMNGVIGMNSNIGEGSEFWFKLPLEHIDTEVEYANQLHVPINTKVLIMAQHKEAGNSLKATLGQWGIKADLAHSVAEAKCFMAQSFIEITPYTLFFVDSKINGQCGIEMARDIRKHSAFDSSGIVIMVPISDSLKQGVVSGIKKSVCINKPLLIGKLRELITDLLNPPKLVIKSADPFPLYNHLTSAYSCYCGDESATPKILVVEDNPVNRELFLEMLAELNLPAKAVSDGHGVLNAVIEEHFDLILLDCRLPDMEGHEIAAKIRNMKVKGKQSIIIVTSSDNSLHNQQLCYESGVDDFLNKPITLSDLSNSIFAWIPEVAVTAAQNKTMTQSTVVNLFSAPILDKDVITSLKSHEKDNPEFFRKLINIFISDSFERIDILKEQLEQYDFAGIERMGHSIKSGCIHIGAKRMAKYCEVLCNMARNQSYAETSRALQHFTEEFDRVILELESDQRPVLEPL